MAIQFSCPYCTASVKVPDSASGKLGACPKCATKIRIPSIPTPPVAAPHPPAAPPVMAPFAMPLLPAPLPHSPMIVDPGPGFPNFLQAAAAPAAAPPPPPPVSTDPFDFSNMSAAAPASSAAATPVSTPSYSKASRKKSSPRKPLSPGVLLAIGLGVLVLAGLGVWQFIANLPVYTGHVAGERFPSERPISVTVPWSSIEVPAPTQPAVIEYFKRHQTSLANPILKLDISASPQGLIIRFSTTADSMLVSVDPQLVPDVKTLIDENKVAWDEARKRELTLFAQQLCDNLAKAQLTNSRLEISDYRDTVALNALVRGLGRHCVGVSQRINYPCVFEDEVGKLYFVVPRMATDVTVMEKSSEGHVKVLPPEFQIWASIPATASATPRVEPVEPEAPVEPEKPAAAEGEEPMKDDKRMKPKAAGEDKMMLPK